MEEILGSCGSGPLVARLPETEQEVVVELVARLQRLRDQAVAEHAVE